MSEVRKYEPANPWLEAASEAGGTGRLLKFVKGKWESGDDEVPNGTEFIARMDQLARGWVKFEDGKATDQIAGKIADGYRLPQRESLGDNDRSKWEIDPANGAPRDPWAAQWFLPMVGMQTGTVLTFVTGSRGGATAIGALCAVYGNREDGGFPIVRLAVRSYRHKTFGRIETPHFTVIGFTGGSAIRATPIARIASPENRLSEIPFNDHVPEYGEPLL